ncbi:glycerophosphodiester phosphodiesterase [Urbifossiella limnaea]|uniref:Glycerophosphoryl diester phosphodiesterase n=1 Tax=Urbifossiella limnaea TaxID=2528023 RepID=A0A517XRC9_9BACT|nr:glycerophosphodiester phosphodiesterase [Urbifossiella limnaea]QDU20002.1 Glycerophosphoryl diester phosphodiesterase [Urbifossiella limnaea]
MLHTILTGLAMTLPADRPVEIVGHRGASHDAPENTVAAVKLAWDQKADAAEFDVYRTKDGKIVVIHDKDTKRTAGGVNKVVAESTLAELRALDVGAWKDKKYAGERIPTLAEVLATVPAGKSVFIEVKPGPEVVPELLAEMKAAGLPPERTPVISFNAGVIAAVKKARPDLPAYWIVSLNAAKDKTPPTAAELVTKAKEIRADGLDLSASPALDAEYAKVVRAAGLKLYVWTVNDVAVARRMVGLGVDGITTDRPGWLREQLAR